MFQKEISVPTERGYSINVVFTHLSSPFNKCVVLLHGFEAENPEQDCLSLQAEKHFIERGFNTIRYALHTFEGTPDSNPRHFFYTSLARQVEDLQSVATAWRRDIPSDLFVCGHSYAGLALMTRPIQHVKAMSLWDPSFDPRRNVPHVIEEGIQCDLYNGKWINKEFAQEMSQVDYARSLKFARELEVPTTIIAAGYNGKKESDAVKYADQLSLSKNNRFAIIEQAEHSFLNPDCSEQLVDISTRFFNDISR